MANFIRSLLNGVMFEKVLAYTSASDTGDTDTTSVDCAGAEGVLFLVDLGTVSTGGLATCKVQQSSDDGSSDAFSDVEGSSLVNIGDASTIKQLLIEVINPQKRYQRLRITRSVGDVVIDGVIAMTFGHKAEAVDQGTTVDGSIQLVAPAEGTA